MYVASLRVLFFLVCCPGVTVFTTTLQQKGNRFHTTLSLTPYLWSKKISGCVVYHLLTESRMEQRGIKMLFMDTFLAPSWATDY
jgi:hypothetical protein